MMFALLLSTALAQDTLDTGAPVTEALKGASLALPLEAGDYTNFQITAPSLLTLKAPPPLVEGVNLIPEGSVVLLRGEDGTFTAWLAAKKSFLLPEAMYDTARLKARQLEICQPALDAITEETLQMADRTYAALSKCGDQFDVDESLIHDLTGQVQTQETRALVAEDRLKQARKNTAVAWAITGGVVLGVSAATVIAVAN